MYRESLHHFIEGEEPVIVPIKTVDALDASKTGEQKFTLAPRNLREETSVRAIFEELLPLLRTKEDWSIVPAFLREFRSTNRVLRQPYISKLIRAAAATEQYGAMIEFVKHSDDTGIFLDSLETATEIMLLCLRRAYAKNWNEKDIEKAARHCDAVIWMMKQPQHAPKGVVASQATQPEILGTALALASLRSIKLKHSQDEDEKVLKYAQDFISNWPKANTYLEDKPIHESSRFLQDWAPAWLGVQLAQRIVKDIEVLRGLNDIFDTRLNSMVMQTVTVMQNEPRPEGKRERRSVELYNAFLAVL